MGDMAEMYSDMYDAYQLSCEFEYFEYSVAKEMSVPELVTFLINNKHKFYLLEREELINGVLNFYKERGYVTPKQVNALCIAYSQINSEELDF